MNHSGFDIERVVTEVLAELRRLAGGAGAVGCPSHGSAANATPRSETPASSSSSAAGQASNASTSTVSTGASATTATSEDGRLVFEGRVLTLEVLSGRLSSVRRVAIQPRTIVTPAVRDELQRRGITLEYLAATHPPAREALRVVTVNALRGFQAAELSGAIRAEGVPVEVLEMDCLIAATDRLAAELRGGGALGLLLTRYVPAALCLANRHAGVRAVAATDLLTMTAAVEAVGANLLVLDATALTAFQLRQMAVQFCRGGVRQCPEALRSRLA